MIIFRWTEKIALVALPEMVFGYSFVTLKHLESGFEMSFNAYDALETVDKNNATVQVGYAEHWKQSKMFVCFGVIG
jgi:type 2A phosphatase activator TIP41